MILKLPFEIKGLPVYPRDREFTFFEALIDYLLEGCHGGAGDRALRWRWNEDQVKSFLAQAPKKDPLWYEEEDNTSRRQKAQDIIDVFNHVFDRDCKLNEYRIRTINARIGEGKKLKPGIGITQFRAVFEYKKKEWTGTEQERYLEIETLCAAKHFLKYLEAARLDYLKTTKAKKTEAEGVVLSGTLFKNNAG